MNLNIKKKLIFLIGLFLTLSTITGISSIANAQSTDSDCIIKGKKSERLPLLKNSNWKQLCNIWKELNRFEIDDNTLQDRLNHYDKVKNLMANVPGLLNNLVKGNSISKEEEAFLNDAFTYRLDYLAFKNQIVNCYSMTEDAYNYLKIREDLELQFDILEKLFRETKINSDTFETARNKIIEDLNLIDKKYPKDSKIYNTAQLSDLIIYLNE